MSPKRRREQAIYDQRASEFLKEHKKVEEQGAMIASSRSRSNSSGIWGTGKAF